MSWEIVHLESCTTTMDEARERARAGAPDGTVVVAERMTGGRGREARTWYAPEGGLYLSLVLRDLHDPHLLTLALGNAVADTLEITGVDARLKWVNDVFVGDKKIGGILVEGESTGDHFDFLVAGIGVNLNGRSADWPDEVRDLAVTLEEALGADSCIEDVETALLHEIGHWVGAVRAGRDGEILDAWRARDLLKGRRVAVDGEDGTQGTAQGIDDRGRLLVDGRAIGTGTVVLLD